MAAILLQSVAPVEQGYKIVRRDGEYGFVTGQGLDMTIHLQQQITQADPACVAVGIEFDRLAVARFRIAHAPHALKQEGALAAR